MPHQLETTHCVELKFFSINSFYGGMSYTVTCLVFVLSYYADAEIRQFCDALGCDELCQFIRLTSHRT
jgi:hypothetical protein